jgi:sugar phosphate isomerase/epimerase
MSSTGPSPATARRTVAPPGDPAPRVGVDTFSYHRWFGETNRWEEPAPARWTIRDTITEARRVGAEVLSIQTIHLDEGDRESLESLRAELAGAGLEPILAWGHRSGLEDGRNSARLDDAVRAAGDAATLGCSMLRVVCGDQLSWRPDPAARAARMAALWEPLTTLAATGERLGLLVAVENHADGPVAELAALVEEIDSPALGLCFDAGNAARVGENAVAAARLAAPHCLMTHLRDLRLREASRGDPAGWWPCVALGEGDLDLPAVLAELAAAPRCRAWLVEASNVLPGYSEPEIVESGIAWLKARR